MAVVRARSAPPYGLFAVTAWAVLATVAAILCYFMYAKGSDEHDKAVKDYAAMLHDNERGLLPGLRKDMPEGGGMSLIGYLNKTLKDAQDKSAQLQQQVDSLTKNLQEKEDNLKRATAQANSAGSSAAQTLSEAKTKQDESEKTLADLNAQLNKLMADLSAANSARDKAVADGQDALNKLNDKNELDRRDQVVQSEQDKSTIVKQAAEIVDLRMRIQNQRGTSVVNVGEPDGQVIRVNGATGELYINLTKKDRVLPGMTFTVYDPRLGVRFGTDDAALGNGSIEVLEVGDVNTLCRITRVTKDRAIQANDLIANLVYHNDRTRKFRFTIYGDFDLDGDGVATAAERDRLISMIIRWGGQVDDDVTSQTDYLVIGARPAAPLLQEQSADATTVPATDAATATAPSSGIIGGINDARGKSQERYDQLVIDAKRLAIPVLNANRFLAMIGYYNTTVVKY
jgi:hypothetical protein